MATKRIILEARTPQTDDFTDTLTWSNLDKLTMDFLRQDKKIKKVLQLRSELKSIHNSVSIETKKLLMSGEQKVREKAFGLRPNLFSRFILQEVEDFGTWATTPGRNGVVIPVLTYTLALMSATITEFNLPSRLTRLVVRDDIATNQAFSGKFDLLVTHLYAQGTYLIDQVKHDTTEFEIRTLTQKLVVLFTTNALRIKVNNTATVKALQAMLDYDMNDDDKYAAWLAKPFCEWDNLYTDCITLSREELLAKVMLFCHSQSKTCATTVTWPGLGLNQAIKNIVEHKSTSIERSCNTLKVLHTLYLARLISNFYNYSEDQLSTDGHILMINTPSLMTCLWPTDTLTFKALAMTEYMRENSRLSRELYLPGKTHIDDKVVVVGIKKECVLHARHNYFLLLT